MNGAKFDEETSKTRIGDIGADAKLVLERGVILSSADSEPIGLPQYFGPQSFHNGDYTFYYNNIKENVAKRIATYLEGRSARCQKCLARSHAVRQAQPPVRAHPRDAASDAGAVAWGRKIV